MKTALVRLAIVVALLFSKCEVGESQGMSLVGSRVYAKSQVAKIRDSKKVIGISADLVYPVLVRKQQGDSLLIWVETKKAEGWIDRNDVCTADEAIEFFSRCITSNANDDSAYWKRSLAYEELGKLANALDDLTELIRLKPTTYAYNSRGSIRAGVGRFDLALQDFDEAIRLKPNFAMAYYNRGYTQQLQGEPEKAISDYNEAIRFEPKYAAPYNAIAWIRAASPDEKLRDGKIAVTLATKACELSEWKNYFHLDTLAVALAEDGRFDEAKTRLQQAIGLGSKSYRQRALKRMALFNDGKPYRDD